MIWILLFMLAFFNTTMLHYLGENPFYYQLTAYTWESEEFRSMKLGPAVPVLPKLDYDQLTGLMLEHDFDLTNMRDLSYHNEVVLLEKPAEYKKLANAYKMVLDDLKYFPIPESTNQDTPKAAFENGWKDKRSYGGERFHEGCDIMGNQRMRGYYPVVSISDGVIEKVGWLEKGGWRIGIRTETGAYIYYAHLYSYGQEFQEGDHVSAGQLLGYMGDSGYGTEENTVGNFGVHLHLGIYIKTDHYEELSINPYWILKYLEQNTLKFEY